MAVFADYVSVDASAVVFYLPRDEDIISPV